MTLLRKRILSSMPEHRQKLRTKRKTATTFVAAAFLSA
jgi:hypothetical protein